ncbi:uncharacterized protein LOC117331232 [Pecten maximus]|uniref:uncharacterized protein LOC117331232 n=1 Tax=Pecten maximus TaxID=6579 RepID=UPI0014580B09|nr:uncharacterized protein LOC117331232 [Pecten maximus]
MDSSRGPSRSDRGLFAVGHAGKTSRRSKRGAHFKVDTSRLDLTEDHSYVLVNEAPINIVADNLDIGAEYEIGPNDNIDPTWKIGRRVVELELLAQNMFCDVCNSPLHLSNTLWERRLGLGSTLHIQCTNAVCDAVCQVDTGKRGSSGAFDVNSKAAIGMVHAGIGPSQVNNFLVECNIPPIATSTLKRKESLIGKTLVEAASTSCRDAQTEEKELSSEKLQASFDGGWQKRGTGFNYNSNTGHAAMIGKTTGKVIAYDVRSKSCRICDIHKDKKETVPSHVCPRNWEGSSKAMEPDMAVSMAHRLSDQGFQLDVFHADNDSTTTAKMLLDFPKLEKKDDQNHVKKGISKSLYELSKKHKELKHAEVIPYIMRCFMYAMTGSNTEAELELSLKRIVPHIFGEHTGCSTVKWCTYKDDPQKFRYKSLPNGTALQDPTLRTRLEELVAKYSCRSGNLLNLGSTQANESFNSLVSTKTPKAKFYGSSDSLMNRVSASVLQKNEGHNYLPKVNESALLSPGEFTVKLTTKLDNARSARKEKEKTREYKLRRVELKRKKRLKEQSSYVKEGTTYETDIDLTINNSSDPDVQTIPSVLSLDESKSLVFFDLETTSASRQSDITQIAAVVNGDNIFHRYVLPRCDIAIKASEVTGLTYSRSLSKMYLRGKEIENVTSIHSALLDFLDFLKTLPNPILVGHNAASFDIPILTNRLREFQLCSSFANVVKGYMDTLRLARRLFPKKEVGSHSQESLVRKFLGMSYEAHNAVFDVKALQDLFNLKMSAKWSVDDVFSMNFLSCKKSYDTLVSKKAMNKLSAEKLSKNGIHFNHLKLAYSRNAISGVKVILCENKIQKCFISNIVKCIQKEE